MNGMEERQIIELLWERSESAIKELENKYGRTCRALAQRILGNSEDAEECVDDAYLAIWTTIPPQRPNSLAAYICRITRNLSLKKYENNTAKKRNGYYDAVLDELAECLQGSAGVEEELLARELGEHINRFLAGIKAKDRIMFVSRYWFGAEISEIAQEFSESQNYVTVHLHRTRKKLRIYLQKEGLLS